LLFSNVPLYLIVIWKIANLIIYLQQILVLSCPKYIKLILRFSLRQSNIVDHIIYCPLLLSSILVECNKQFMTLNDIDRITRYVSGPLALPASLAPNVLHSTSMIALNYIQTNF